MNKPIIRKFFIGAFLALVLASASHAQDVSPTSTPEPDAAKPRADGGGVQRLDILRQLGLNKEQVQRIRRANVERKPLLDAAQTRFRDANKALDEAIYADALNEQDVQARLKETQLAQAELIKVRFMSELTIRRILTAEQLTRFRDLRQRFAQMREDRPGNPRTMLQNRQLRRQNQNGFKPNVPPTSERPKDKPEN